VCELQQRGTASVAYTPVRYSLMDDMVHAFDLMLADGYAADGITTRFPPRHDKWRESETAARRRVSITLAASRADHQQQRHATQDGAQAIPDEVLQPARA